MVHNCLYHIAPRYLMDCCIPVSDVASRRHLRSARRNHLVVPRHSLSSYGRRAFAVAGPAAWNSLSDDLHDPTLSTDSFRRLLGLICSQSTSTYSAYIEVSHFMRYTNLRLTYLLTYLLQKAKKANNNISQGSSATRLTVWRDLLITCCYVYQ